MSEPLESALAGVGVDTPHQADFPLGSVRHHPEAPGDLNLGQAAAAPTYGELQVARTREYEVSGLHLKFRAWDFCFKWDRSDLLWSIPVDIRSVVLLARSEVPWGLQNLRCRG
jgi:hypothetical protein